MYVPSWPTLTPFDLLAPKSLELPYPLGAERRLACHVARSAIYHLFRALQLDPSQVVLLPDYHHGNEVLAIRAAGAKVRFYPILENLQPDLDALKRLATPECRVLFTIHYLGWPQPLDALRALSEERGLILIEDCALSMLSESGGQPLGTSGDFSVFCPYKTLPIPNGGWVVQNKGQPLPGLFDLALEPCDRLSLASRSIDLMLESMLNRFPRTGRSALWAKARAGRLLTALELDRVPVGDTGFDPRKVRLEMAPLSAYLLQRFDYGAIRRKRRSAFAYLEERFLGRGATLGLRLAPGVVPLFFPILVADKHATAEALRKSGVQVVEFWNAGDPESGDNPDAAFLRAHLLELPVHQDLSPAQLEYLSDRVLALDPWVDKPPRHGGGSGQPVLRNNPPIEVEVLRGDLGALERLAPEWDRLCDEGPCSEPFYRPAWIGAHLRAFGPDGSLVLIAARRGGRLRAVLPLVEEVGRATGMPVRRLRGAANIHSCRFDLVHGREEKIDQAIWEALKGLRGWDELVIPDVPEGGAFGRILALARRDGWPSGWWESMRTPFISLVGGPKVSAKLRANLRRRRKKLEARGAVKLRRIDQADPKMLEAFYALEARGWKGEARSAISLDDPTRRFYNQVAQLSARRGELSMYILECGGRPVAIHLGLTAQNRYFLPKLAYDEEFRDCSPGQLLTEGVVEDVKSRGVTEFDFLGPWMPWKGDWTDQVRPHGFVHVFRRNAYGRLLEAAKFRWLPKLRG